MWKSLLSFFKRPVLCKVTFFVVENGVDEEDDPLILGLTRKALATVNKSMSELDCNQLDEKFALHSS